MTILICGLGSIGRRHLRNLQSLGRDDLVLLRTGKSTLPDDELKGMPVEKDLRSALEHWRPEGVIIATPTSLHLDIAIPAAQAGCQLLIEKPISHSIDRLEELQAALNIGGGQVLVGFQFRFHPGLVAVKQLLDDYTIGDPISGRVHWGEYLPDWHPWEDYRNSYSARSDLGGGVVVTLCHPFDYLRWLFGEVIEVTAMVGQLGGLEIDVEDTAEILLRFESGPLASVHLDYNQRPPAHWLEIIGSQGTLHWDNANGATRWWSAKSEDWHEILPPKDFERNSLFLAEMKHFLEVIAGTATPICAFEDGVRALEIALAARQSAQQRSSVPLVVNKT